MTARSFKEPAGPLQARFTEARLAKGDTLAAAAAAVAYAKGGLLHFAVWRAAPTSRRGGAASDGV